jgi:hypothetical protein
MIRLLVTLLILCCGTVALAQHKQAINLSLVSRFSVNQGVGAGGQLGYYRQVKGSTWWGTSFEYSQLIGAWNGERRFMLDWVVRRMATQQRLVQWYYEGGIAALHQTYKNYYTFDEPRIKEQYIGVVTGIGFFFEVGDHWSLGLQLRTHALFNSKGPVVQLVPMTDLIHRF